MSMLIGVYGASGCGRGIMPLVRDEWGARADQIVFVDDAPTADVVNGHCTWTWSEFLVDNRPRKGICIAIAASPVRQRLAERCTQFGIPLVGVRARNVVVMDDVEIGEGALLSPFVTLTSNIRIGRCFHANLYSYVEHDCVIGNFVTFAPGVKCNGNVVIEDHAYIGSGAILKQGTPDRPLTIGRGAVVGMGAVVTSDVPPHATVVGNPARQLQRN